MTELTRAEQAREVFLHFVGTERLLVCGDRNWTDRQLMWYHMEEWGVGKHTTVIHGGAMGADTLAGDIAMEMGAQVWRFPADWIRYSRAAGPIRNQQMIDEGKPHWVLAFHPDIRQSKGTADLVRRAVKASIICHIVNANGYSVYR